MECDGAPSQSVRVRQTAATPSPDKVVDAVLCYWPDVPRHSPLVRLPNMTKLRDPGQAPPGSWFSLWYPRLGGMRL
jgi:hypothetical protein